MYIYIHTCAQTHRPLTHKHIYIYSSVLKEAYINTNTHAYVIRNTNKNTKTFLYKRAHTHTHPHIRMCVHTHMHMHKHTLIQTLMQALACTFIVEFAIVLVSECNKLTAELLHFFQI